MGTITSISWCDHTFNPWIGCTRVSEGCRHCYAETLSNRYKWVKWGPGGARRVTTPLNWTKPIGWNHAAGVDEVRRRVFCASLADVFDPEAQPQARDRLWELIAGTPNLDWLILTKRPENILAMLPETWGDLGWPNVWLGVSAEDQETYEQRWRVLSRIPATVRFVSYEPALGPLTLSTIDIKPDWLIWGGESGPGARQMRPKWAKWITTQCEFFLIPVFGKQWGTWASNPLVYENGLTVTQAKTIDSQQFGKGGAMLFGKLWREFPVGVNTWHW